MTALPFLTIAEAAALARVSPKRLRNLMASGTLREGVHFTRPDGLGPRFKREALLVWLEGQEQEARQAFPPTRSRKQSHCKLDLSLV